MPTLFIDGQAIEVPRNLTGQNLLHVVLSMGLNLPYFCWHPALGSVGACRQCAVMVYRDENDRQGRLMMACMTPFTDGMRIGMQDGHSTDFRRAVIEWLMTNHPHDCPVCDEGGECHLQDMTQMTGQVYRKYRFKKRTHRNQNLGPFIHHEMNRCIACYRCVRFYRDYAGGSDLNVFGTHNDVYFGRYEDGTLENEFSGNLVEVCPTGVFTDKTLAAHYTRKWDLQTAPSVCVHCGHGCNTIPGERYGELRRIVNRYNDEVNGYFICDRGRFGYQFTTSDRRIRDIWVKRAPGAIAEKVAKGAALEWLSTILTPEAKVVGIGSPRASLEANFALRELVGPDRFYTGLSARESRLVATMLEVLKAAPAPSPTLRELEEADCVLVLGEDILNTAPRVALALQQTARFAPAEEAAQRLKIGRWHDAAIRDAIQDARAPIFLATMAAGKLDAIARRTFHGAPDDLARLGFAIAHGLDEAAAEAPSMTSELREFVAGVTEALSRAKRPLVISGIHSGSQAVIHAAANISRALAKKEGKPGTRLYLAAREPNSLGVLSLVEQPAGRNLERALDEIEQGRADTVIILENDLHRRVAPGRVDQSLTKASHVVVIEQIATAATRFAEVILPAAVWAEADGTLINNEGRAQRHFQVYVPETQLPIARGGAPEEPPRIQESWRWLRDTMIAARRLQPGQWENLDAILGDLCSKLPALSAAREAAPSADFRIAGQRIPRESHRYSGRTAMRAQLDIHEPRPPADVDAPMSFSMEGFEGQPPPALVSRYWAPQWNSVQALTRFQEEVGGPLRGGAIGKRLFAGAGLATETYYPATASRLKPLPGQWLLLPLYQIFGSDELSALSPSVRERAPRPYAAISPTDAQTLGIREGDLVELGIATDRPQPWLPARITPSQPNGTLGIPFGIGDWQEHVFWSWTRVKAVPAGAAEAREKERSKHG